MIMQSFHKTMFSIARTTLYFKTLSLAIKSGKSTYTSVSHVEAGIWLFVFECDSQPPRGDPHLQKHPEIEKYGKHITLLVSGGAKFIINL